MKFAYIYIYIYMHTYNNLLHIYIYMCVMMMTTIMYDFLSVLRLTIGVISIPNDYIFSLGF